MGATQTIISDCESANQHSRQGWRETHGHRAMGASSQTGAALVCYEKEVRRSTNAVEMKCSRASISHSNSLGSTGGSYSLRSKIQRTDCDGRSPRAHSDSL